MWDSKFSVLSFPFRLCGLAYFRAPESQCSTLSTYCLSSLPGMLIPVLPTNFSAPTLPFSLNNSALRMDGQNIIANDNCRNQMR